jgi:hypothetical protein
MRSRKEEKAARDYSSIYSPEAIEAARREKERLARVKMQEKQEREANGEIEDQGEDKDEADSDDSFM